MTRKQTFAFAAKILVSAGLIWLIASKVDLGAAKDRLFQVSMPMLIAGILFFAIQLLIGGVRWKVVTDAIGVRFPLAEAIRLFVIGAFFNQALPSSIGGDAVRIYKAYRGGMNLAAAFNGVFLERAGTVLALLLVVAATQPALAGRVAPDMAGILLASAAIAFVAGIGGLVFLAMLHRLPASLDRFKAIRGFRAVAVDTRRVFFVPGPLARLLVWGVLTHVNLTFAVYLLSLSLDLGITWLDCLALVPPVILATTLPISVGGWGVREGAMIYAFGLIGVPADGALVLSILLGLVGIVIALPGGVLWFRSGDRRLSLDSETRA